MRFGIAGAGAVGCHYGSLLQQAGYDVFFCTRGYHLHQLQKRGLHHVTGNKEFLHQVHASDDCAVMRDVDVILLTCKMTGLLSFLTQLKPYVSKKCIFMTMQNGVTAPHVVSNIFPDHAVFSASAFIGVRMPEAGYVVHSAAGHIVFGTWQHTQQKMADHLCAAFDLAGIPYAVKEDMVHVLWNKMLWNCGFNAFSALTKRYAQSLMENPMYVSLIRQAMLEVLAVAQAKQINLNESHIEKHLQQTAKAGLIQSSMWQDISAGKITEINFLNGYVVSESHKLGLNADVNVSLMTLIDALQNATSG